LSAALYAFFTRPSVWLPSQNASFQDMLRRVAELMSPTRL
jgi:hypothetical protein